MTNSTPLPIAMAVDILAAPKVVEPSMSVVTGDETHGIVLVMGIS